MFSPEEQVAEPANMSRTSKSFQELKLGCQKTKQESKQKKDRAEIQLGLIDLTSLNLLFQRKASLSNHNNRYGRTFQSRILLYQYKTTSLVGFFFEKQVW